MLKIGVDIDNVLSNFDEVLKEQYLKHDKILGGRGIVNKNTLNMRLIGMKNMKESFI